MSDALVLRDDADAGVTTLTLNRPNKLNALTPEVFEHLHRRGVAIAVVSDFHVDLRPHFAALEALEGDSGCKPVLLANREAVHEIPFPGGERDLDTPEEWRAFEARLHPQR